MRRRSRRALREGLGELAAAIDAVHDLQGAVLVSLEVGDVLHEFIGFPVELEEVQGAQGECRVADPGVAVVPVALPPGVSGSEVVSAATVAPVGM